MAEPQVNSVSKSGRRMKRLISRLRGRKSRPTTTTESGSIPSTASPPTVIDDPLHEQNHVDLISPPHVAKPALPVRQHLSSLPYRSLSDHAVSIHRQSCSRAPPCPCDDLEMDHLEDSLREAEASAETSKTWIRQKLQSSLPSLKTMEPWLDIVDAVAQVNPISGQVSGLVKVALKMAIVIGDQYDDVVASLQYIREILCLLALYGDDPPPDLADDVVQAYVDVFDFLCTESAHKREHKEAEDRLAKSVKRLESKATPTILNIVSRLAKLQTLAEMERKGDECVKELHDTGTPNEENVGIARPAKDTCEWVYDCSNSDHLQSWRDWRDSKDSGIMLLTGGIGAGKSTLALSTVDALRNHPSPHCRLVSASFCRDQAAYNNCESILRGLLYGIARHDQEARENLVRHRENSGLVQFGRNLDAFTSFDTLSECFRSCVEGRKKELCLVVDGLDECEEDSRCELLSYFTTLVEGAQGLDSSPPLKVLFFSRPINTILNSLPSSKRLDLRQVREADETRRIIEHLVQSKLPRVDTVIRSQVISLLEKKADGCIQWATVVVGHLRQFGVNKLEDVESELDALSDGPNGLDGTYLTLFGRHFDENSAEYANLALRLVAGAARSLSVDELANAMIVNQPQCKVESKEDFKKAAKGYRIERLQPFVRISTQSSLIFMHSSLRGLISRTSHLGTPSSITFVDNAISKLTLSTLLARTCLDFLLLPYFRTQDVRKDFNVSDGSDNWLWCIQTDSGEKEDEVSEDGGDQMEESKVGPAFFTYAVERWANHLSDTDFSRDLIQKSNALSEIGSMQCYNWWEQFKFGAVSLTAWEAPQMSPLLAAIWFGHNPIVNALLQDFSERSSTFCQNNASRSGREEFVTYESLTLAIRKGNFDTFELLFNNATVDEIKTNGHWYLLSALEIRQGNVFDVLVNDPRVELTRRTENEPKGRTILTSIARSGDIASLWSLLELLETDRRNEVMTLLNDKGDEDDCSPLWYAANYGHTELVETICNLDPDLIRPQLHCHGKFGDHIVAAAARGGDERIMEALLKQCPEYVDRPCAGNNTPLSMTRWNSNDRAVRVAEVLLATRLVDIESTDELGQTPLMKAFGSARLDLCKLLIRNGADLSKAIQVSENNETALLMSTGFPAQDIMMRDALLQSSQSADRVG